MEDIDALDIDDDSLLLPPALAPWPSASGLRPAMQQAAPTANKAAPQPLLPPRPALAAVPLNMPISTVRAHSTQAPAPAAAHFGGKARVAAWIWPEGLAWSDIRPVPHPGGTHERCSPAMQAMT